MLEDKEIFLNKLLNYYHPEVSVWYNIYLDEGCTHEQALNKLLRNKHITKPCVGLPAHYRELKTKW